MTDDNTESTVTDEKVHEYLVEHGSPRLLVQLEQSVVTPIELAKALEIRPQMVYNYIRSGRIKAHTTADTQKIVINLEDAKAFVRTRLEKDAAKAAKIVAELESAAPKA